MLTEQEIQQALGASYVVPLDVPNPHGPFGWEHVTQAVADVLASRRKGSMIVQPLELSRATWGKTRTSGQKREQGCQSSHQRF
jgi:hypothetical protein